MKPVLWLSHWLQVLYSCVAAGREHWQHLATIADVYHHHRDCNCYEAHIAMEGGGWCCRLCLWQHLFVVTVVLNIGRCKVSLSFCEGFLLQEVWRRSECSIWGPSQVPHCFWLKRKIAITLPIWQPASGQPQALHCFWKGLDLLLNS